MDLGGALSMDGLVGVSSECGSLLSCSLTSSNTEVSRFQKLGRSAQPDDCGWRFPKMARTESMVAAPIKAAPFLPGSNPHSLFPDGEQMLSFSSTSKQDALMLSCDETKSYYCPPSASSSTPPYLRNGGLYSGSSSWNMNGVLARVRGPFTPFQWLELEHQALIYKYIVAEVPIPANLLTPIRRSLISSGFPPLGWGSFYLEYPGNADPEPGRCRRTDGKKWRCSRDAVADQKYCERHMNRGRHRSRKHVEGQSGHAAKAMPVIAPSQSATTVSSAKSSSSVSIGQHQTKILQPNIFETSPAEFDKTVMNKENANGHGKDLISLSMLTSMNPKPSSALLPISKQHNAFESTSSRADFRLASTDSHLNPSSSSFSDNIFIPTSKLEDLQPRVHPLHHFIDDLPKTQSDHSTITWPEIEEMQSERTQLSISIPVASSDFSSSSSYPNHENLTPLPIKLSQEFDLVHMDSQAGVLNEVNQRQTSWIPISWEASMAGPLGEVLTNTNSIPKDQSKNCSSSSLNLLTDSWDTSCRLESSPTGVLQKNSFGSLTSSTASSPRAENNKAQENVKARAMTLLAQPL